MRTTAKFWFIFALTCFCLGQVHVLAQTKLYPTHWFTGMKYNRIQVMLHGQLIGSSALRMQPYAGVRMTKVHRVENPNYLFVDLTISPSAKPGTLVFQGAGEPVRFELKSRRSGRGNVFAQGVDSRDFIYLIMPDRFANGDPTNDRIAGMRDQTLNRQEVFHRHGGDLLGIQNHLDYLQNLGVTTLWLNPVIENDRPERTEHGYAFTDHYKIDRRLGGEKAYQNLIDAVHKRGMKIIQDAVYNHVDSNHFTILDRPMRDWLNNWDTYTNTTYKDQVLFDPYAAPSQYKQMSDGWFTRQMPDLNQRNPYVANFLIQHAIWSVEEFGLDGWRIDTYAYNDLAFMNRCNAALEAEYPKITMFGETWVHGVLNQSYFCQNTLNIPFKSNLQAVTDFQTLWGIQDALTQDFGWTSGVTQLYTRLAYDYVYKDPMRNVIFLDNHDIPRFFSVLNENLDKYKVALMWLFTARGIPQMYYTSEFATPGLTSPNDGYVRLDFPGGWASDSINKFKPEGRKGADLEIYTLVQKLANFRKTSSALTTGKFMQYIPEDGVYGYFRYDNKQTIFVVMNTAKEKKEVRMSKYNDLAKSFQRFRNVVTGETGSIGDFSLNPYQAVVLELLP